MKDDGGPAFPHDVNSITFSEGNEEGVLIGQGMTLRDYFAAKAMATYLLNVGILWTGKPPSAESLAVIKEVSEAAYAVADAMLAARSA